MLYSADGFGLNAVFLPDDAVHAAEDYIAVVESADAAREFALRMDIPPVLTINPTSNLSVTENSIEVVAPTIFVVEDEDAVPVQSYRVEGVPANGNIQLQLAGTTLAVGDSFTAIDLANNSVTINASDADGGSAESFAIVAILSDGQESNEATVAFTVVEANDNPQINPSPQLLPENSTLVLTSAMFNYSDEEGDANLMYVVETAPNVPGVSLLVNGVYASGSRRRTSFH